VTELKVRYVDSGGEGMRKKGRYIGEKKSFSSGQNTKEVKVLDLCATSIKLYWLNKFGDLSNTLTLS
jgi:hypothetical protein